MGLQTATRHIISRLTAAAAAAADDDDDDVDCRVGSEYLTHH